MTIIEDLRAQIAQEEAKYNDVWSKMQDQARKRSYGASLAHVAERLGVDAPPAKGTATVLVWCEVDSGWLRRALSNDAVGEVNAIGRDVLRRLRPRDETEPTVWANDEGRLSLAATIAASQVLRQTVSLEYVEPRSSGRCVCDLMTDEWVEQACRDQGIPIISEHARASIGLTAALRITGRECTYC